MNKSEITDLLIKALDGDKSHLAASKALEGLTIKTAGRVIENIPYTIWQQIGHINFWQDIMIARLKGENTPDNIEVADGWPPEKSPANAEELEDAIDQLCTGLATVKVLLLYAEELYHSPSYHNGYEQISVIASHLSYHLGQIMLMRRLTGDYPPPSGGYVW